MTTLPDVKAGEWNFSQLFVGDQRRNRPRLPKEGFYFVAARAAGDAAAGRTKGDDRFRFPPRLIQATWKNLGDVEVSPFFAWFNPTYRIASVDAAANTVTFTAPQMRAASYAQVKPGTRFLVENVAEALDTPGQWYLNRPTGVLTYLPLPGETPEHVFVVAPKLEKLIVLDAGDLANAADAPVSHLAFRGLSFAHTNWVVPPQGYGVPQAVVTISGGVYGRGAHDCRFEGCSFEHMGTYGIDLDIGCQDDAIESCRFIDLGAGGIKIGTTHAPNPPQKQVKRHTIRDNQIAHVGRTQPAAVGIWVGQASEVNIEHNDIHDLYYTAISIGWTWGGGPSEAHDNTVAWNHIHTIGQGVLSDMGFIYTLGISPGTRIHHNLMHDIERFGGPGGYGGWGIYYDEGSTGIVAEDNLVYHTHDGGFHQHYGEENTVRNNIFGPSIGVQFGPTRLDWPSKLGVVREPRVFTFENNIVDGWADPSVIRTNWMNKLLSAHLDKFQVDHNVYWNGTHGGEPPMFAGLTLEAWREKGLDKHSVVADPGFASLDKDDYRLSSESPALRLGFKPFDVSGAGRTTHEPPDATPAQWPRMFPPSPGPQAIQDSFEETPVGSAADGATTVEENDVATIRVTDAVAHSGKRSLRFTDAAGQKQRHDPYVFWAPMYADGIVVCRFAVRPKAGAEIAHEWRTPAVTPAKAEGSNYRVGPSFRIDASGALRVGHDKSVAMKLPLGEWTTFEITCPLGRKAGTYDLAITAAGGETLRLSKLPCAPGFDRLGWFGFTAAGEKAATFYLDDLELRIR